MAGIPQPLGFLVPFGAEKGTGAKLPFCGDPGGRRLFPYASDAAFLEEKLWPALRGLHINSVVVPLYGELIEPEEGRYDFSLPERIVSSARREGLKLCFLWFGLWTNAESMSGPARLKRDTETCFRTEKVSAEKRTAVSPLCAAALSSGLCLCYRPAAPGRDPPV